MVESSMVSVSSIHNNISTMDLSQHYQAAGTTNLGMESMVCDVPSYQSETPPPSPPESAFTSRHGSVSSISSVTSNVSSVMSNVSSPLSNQSSIPAILDEVEAEKTYAILESPNQKQLPFIPSSMDTSASESELNRWEKVHPINWTSEEVMDFIYWLALYATTEGSIPEIKADRLRNSCGLDLMHMSPQDFQEVSPEYGHLFYKKFQTLLQQAEFSYPPQCVDHDEFFGNCIETKLESDPCLSSLNLADKALEADAKSLWNIHGINYQFDPQDQFCSLPFDHHNYMLEDPGYMSGDSTATNYSSCYGNESPPQIPMVTPNVYQPPMMNQRPHHENNQSTPLAKKRGPGRPKKKKVPTATLR